MNWFFLKKPIPPDLVETETKVSEFALEAHGTAAVQRAVLVPEFAKGSIFRVILRMGMPSLIGFLSINMYDLADMFWVSKLGSQYIAAIALFEGFFWVLCSTNDIAGLGSISVISRRYGQGRLTHAATAIKETFLLKILCAVGSSIIGLIFLRDLMRLMGAEGEVVELGVAYGRVRLMALPIFFCTYSVFTSLRSIEAPKMAMSLMLIGNLMNAVIDPLLIFGIGPFPELGIAGAAWASAFSYTITLMLGLYVLFTGKAPIRLHWRGEVPIQLKTMIHMMKIGLPGGVNMVSYSLARAVVMPLVAIFGTDVVAAYGIGMRVSLVGIFIVLGIGLGVSPLIGNLLGAHQKERAKKTAKQSMFLSFGIMLIISSLMFTFAAQIITVFFREQNLLEIGVELLRIWALGLPFLAVWIMGESIFHGAGNNIPPMVISIVTSWIIEIPLIITLTSGFGLDQSAVWWVRFFYFISGACAITYWLYRGKWMEKSV